MARKGRGRQKLEMVKISNESNLQVTFSKRRSGLFKKASELCTLCGVDVAIIVFSPGKKVYSFGHPCVESVMDRFITRNPPQISGTMQLIEAHHSANIRELNMELTQVVDQLEIEKKRGEELTQLIKASQRQHWCQAPIDELSPPQLADLKVALEKLKNQVIQQVEKLMIESSATQYFPGSSSTGGIFQFDPPNNNSNLSNEGITPPPLPPPMIQSSAHPLDFSNNFGFNTPNMNMVTPPQMIQSSAPPQYFRGSSSTGGINPLDPNNMAFNPLNTNMTPLPPYHQHQPLHFSSSPQPPHPGVNHRFY